MVGGQGAIPLEGRFFGLLPCAAPPWDCAAPFPSREQSINLTGVGPNSPVA